MLYPVIALVIGLVALALSADRFTESAAAIAEHFGMSQLMIGLTIVAFGTSAPEIIVSINAALNNAGGIALGNAIGSNLANTGLVLGTTAIIFPIVTLWSSVRNEICILILICLFGGYCLLDGTLSRFDGIALLTALFAACVFIVRSKLSEQRAAKAADPQSFSSARDNSQLPKQIFSFLVYLILLVGSANLLVWGAKQVAVHFGISELVIGLTIVAIGTSLPELAASIASALKQQHDIALGNIIGSNIFNIGAVLGFAGIIAPFEVPEFALSRDYAFMFGLTLFMFAITWGAYKIKRQDEIKIGRGSGITLILCYVVYSIILLRASM